MKSLGHEASGTCPVSSPVRSTSPYSIFFHICNMISTQRTFPVILLMYYVYVQTAHQCSVHFSRHATRISGGDELQQQPHTSVTAQCSPELNRTMALRQLYSAESTRSALSFSTWSWNTRMWSMKATTRSAAIGLA